GDRIQCTVKSFHVYLFERNILEGNVYMISNLSVALNAAKFKPTFHEFRMFFKRETEVRLIEDSTIPNNVFSFFPFKDILNEELEDRHLVDVIGLLSDKGDLIEFKRNGKICNYVVLELDDLEGGNKLRCTLWEDFAHDFLRQLDEDKSNVSVIVLQFAKMKFFKGSMGVSNNTYNTKMFVNPNFPEVAAFKTNQSLTQLAGPVVLSAEEEFLQILEFKSIVDLKEMEQHCDVHYSSFDTRYSIQVRIVDETDSASFMILTKRLPIFWIFLQLNFGGDKNNHPEEIDAFKEKKILLKVNIKMQNQFSVLPNIIKVVRLCYDENLINAFIQKYKTEEVGFMVDNSEVMTQFIESSDVIKFKTLESKIAENTITSISILEEIQSMKAFDNDSSFKKVLPLPDDDEMSINKIGFMVENSELMTQFTESNDVIKDNNTPGMDKCSKSSSIVEEIQSMKASENDSSLKKVLPLPDDAEMSAKKMRKIIKQEKP
ncbi:Nucleic acid-binding, OB-fold, partial [Sesbania bispinosa]